MRGYTRVLFAGLAAFLRALAWLPLNLGWRISWLADWCELRAGV